MRNDILASTLGDKQALKKLKTTHVYCGWQGDHIVLHARFKNGLAAHITVHITPTYVLKNAGKHGDGLTSQQDIGIDAGAVRDWTGDLGAPAGGIRTGTTITKCVPRVASIDLG